MSRAKPRHRTARKGSFLKITNIVSDDFIDGLCAYNRHLNLELHKLKVDSDFYLSQRDLKEIFGKDDVIVKIRYRKQENRCTVTLQPDNTLCVRLHDPLTAVAPGQAAAFYRGDVVLGGGIIEG